ncbi:MAG: hypothetical protein LWW85_13885, partial [Marinilabiliales bacterium]|nr:hypothetical protein [Marinilabiliales bacterium]
PDPSWLMLFLFLPLLLLLLLPLVGKTTAAGMKKGLLILTLGYALLTVWVLFFPSGMETDGAPGFGGREKLLNLKPVNPLREATQVVWPDSVAREGCLHCHHQMKGLSPSHQPKVMGCTACHGGDPLSIDKTTAHSGMILVPGNLSDMRQTCGTSNCHGEIAERISRSPMTTQSGLLAVDHFVFGEASSLQDSFSIEKTSHTAAGTHVRNLCAGCHLGKEKTTPGAIGWLQRGGGCNACHLHYSDEATQGLERMRKGLWSDSTEFHPQLDLQITDEACKSCHSRSGRISLGYEGWTETTLTAAGMTDPSKQKLLPDERVLERRSADVHYQKGMICIDCHGSYEAMGNGRHIVHKEEAVMVQCVDCHPLSQPQTQTLSQLPDRESHMVAWLRNYPADDRVVLTKKGALPLLNTRLGSDGSLLLRDKTTGKDHLAKPAAGPCREGKAHSRLSCGSCHTAWVPQCIGCHTTYEEKTRGFDRIEDKQVTGTWVEYSGKILTDPPVLGIDERTREVVTALPGMVMTLEKSAFPKGGADLFHRLYAPASGHTTMREGRTCKSCHNDPLALGYGRGLLQFKDGSWQFTPRFEANAQDGLPEDAWIPFLQEAKGHFSTRSWLRPLSLDEQKHVLLAGSCLTCHGDQSPVMRAALTDFQQVLARRKASCTPVRWNR